MILELGYEDRLGYGADVKNYMDIHFKNGWRICDDDITMLYNPETKEYCKFYVATDEDFKHDELNFDYFAGDAEDRDYAEKQFKTIQYHMVINASFSKIVRLGKKKLYCCDSGCFILTADPADVYRR